MLRLRSNAPELMDGDRVDFDATDRALRELETINRLTLAYRPTLTWLESIADRLRGGPISLLDAGCGHGDMLRKIARWAEPRGLAFQLTGIDLNPLALRSANEAATSGASAEYLLGDVLELDRGFDIVISSLFLHHLDDEQVVRYFIWMEQNARLAWLVSDLHRHIVPYVFAKGWFNGFGFGRFVRNDGPVSIARGFRRDELAAAVARAGIDAKSVEISWCMPFRYRVARLK